jgi:hypothetical protein
LEALRPLRGLALLLRVRRPLSEPQPALLLPLLRRSGYPGGRPQAPQGANSLETPAAAPRSLGGDGVRGRLEVVAQRIELRGLAEPPRQGAGDEPVREPGVPG